jgi:4-amino-4-deoxy-L-arabinose transferase-like glycosyltransferase
LAKRFQAAGAAFLIVAALAPAAYMAWSGRDVPQLGYFQDDGIYLIGAKSLAEGSGYRILSLPGQPYQTKYPPLYPLVLSTVWKAAPAFPGNLPWALLASWVWVPVLVALCGLHFRDSGFGPRETLALCVLAALNPVVGFFGMSLMSDIMFSALLLAAVIVAERAEAGDGRPIMALVAGLLAALAYVTKTAALPLLVTVPAVYLWRRRKLQAALFLIGMAPGAAAWTIWARLHTLPSSDMVTLFYTNYAALFGALIAKNDLPAMLLTNADALLRGAGGLILFHAGDGVLAKGLLRVIALISVAGIVRRARQRGITHFQALAVLYSAMLICWPFTPNERFLLPLLPLIWGGFFTECANLISTARMALRVTEMDQRIAAGAILVCVAGFTLFASDAAWLGYTRFLPDMLEEHRSALRENRKAFEWIARNTPPQAEFLAYQDTLLYLYAQRRGIRMILPSAPFYHGDKEAILGQFNKFPEFGIAHGLKFVFATDLDYDTDLDADGCRTMRREVDSSGGLDREFSSPHDAVYAVARPAV